MSNANVRDYIVRYFTCEKKAILQQEFSGLEAELDAEIEATKELILNYQIDTQLAARRESLSIRRNNADEAKLQHESKQHNSELTEQARSKASALLLIKRALHEIKLQSNLNQINIKQLMDHTMLHENRCARFLCYESAIKF